MLCLRKYFSPVLPQVDITCSVQQQQSLILHLFMSSDPTASASTPDTSSKTTAHVHAAAICCQWDIAVTYFYL